MHLIMGAIAPVVAQPLMCSKQAWQLGHKHIFSLRFILSSVIAELQLL